MWQEDIVVQLSDPGGPGLQNYQSQLLIEDHLLFFRVLCLCYGVPWNQTDISQKCRCSQDKIVAVHHLLQDLRKKRKLGDGPEVRLNCGIKIISFLDEWLDHNQSTKLIRSRTQGPMVWKTSLKRRGGMLSSGQWEGQRCWIISVKAERDTCSNLTKMAGQVGESLM